MAIYDDVVETARRTMVLFFVVDTSGSMNGSKIGTVNSAIEEIIPELKAMSENNSDAQIKIATLAFSTGARWMDSAPVAAENYRWNCLDANGVTDLGAACFSLNEKLSRKAFMNNASGSFAPAVFLLSDGEPTDNFRIGLGELKQNNWFRKAIKVAIAIGDDANESVLAEFTGNVESVITVHTPGELKKWIQFVSVRSCEIGSKSSNAGSGTGEAEIESKQDTFVEEITSKKNEDEQDAANGADNAGSGSGSISSSFDDGIEW